MTLSREEILNYEPLYLSGSKGSYYYNQSENICVKVLNECLEMETKNIEMLCQFPVIKNSGYPLEPLIVDDKIVGYVCCFYENALPFGKKTFSLEEKFKAIKDNCNQLRQIHERDIIFNDMHCGNQLIDSNGGHLVDFEDVWIPSICETPPASKYYLYKQYDVIEDSKKSDQLKQYIASLQLIYHLNFESHFEFGNIQDLVEFFSFSQDISAFLSSNIEKLDDFDTEVLDYFDILLPKFNDEEKVVYEKKKLIETTALVSL